MVVVVVVVVPVMVVVLMRVRVGRAVVLRDRDNLDAAVLDAAHCKDAVGEILELVGPAPHDDDLEAQVEGQVDVQGCPNALTELVLKLRQLIAEIADVVVVDERQGADRLDPSCDLCPPDLAAREIAQQLGAGAAPLGHQPVELPEQGILDRDAEPDQRILHGQRSYLRRTTTTTMTRPAPTGGYDPAKIEDRRWKRKVETRRTRHPAGPHQDGCGYIHERSQSG